MKISIKLDSTPHLRNVRDVTEMTMKMLTFPKSKEKCLNYFFFKENIMIYEPNEQGQCYRCWLYR